MSQLIDGALSSQFDRLPPHSIEAEMCLVASMMLDKEVVGQVVQIVDRDSFYRDYEAATGFTIDDDVCRYYNALYAMRSVAFWMSASGLYAAGQSDDIRLARTAWSVPVVLERAARELGY